MTFGRDIAQGVGMEAARGLGKLFAIGVLIGVVLGGAAIGLIVYALLGNG